MNGLVELYCSVDDFWKQFKNEWEKHLIDRAHPHGPDPEFSNPEMMTIVILFHQSNFRTFKHFYCDYVLKFLRKEFPKLISYSRFVYLMKNLFVPLFAFLLHNRGKITGIAFIDSTKIQICHDLAPELGQLISRRFHAGTFSFSPTILSKNSRGVRPSNAVCGLFSL